MRKIVRFFDEYGAWATGHFCLYGEKGGWENSEMREFIGEKLFNALLLNLKVSPAIKSVYKISDGGADNKTLVTTVDKCWLASYEEVGFPQISGNLSGQGEVYSDVFSTNKNTRVKYIYESAEAGRWWLRSSDYASSNSNMFWRVQLSGASYGDIASNKYYVAFCFCI